MSKTTLKIRIDDELKRDADGLFGSLGLDTSTAIRMFLHASIANCGFPFKIKRPTPNKETLQAIDDVRLGRNLHGPFSSIEDLMADLEKEDEEDELECKLK